MKNKIDIHALVSLIKNFDCSLLSDTEWDKFRTVDLTNEVQLLELFSEIVCPEYESMDMESQKIIKNALIGALSSPEFNFNDVLNRVELPFAPIREQRMFFLTLWKALFKEDFE
jgi:hypothetical protein